MITPNDFTRINNDTNGNPRYVCHFLRFITDSEYEYIHKYYRLDATNKSYKAAISRAKQLGGRKFHNKQYGGGIVFQSYNLQNTCDRINELIKNL